MLNQLKPVEGARKERKRLGRGIGSGTGKTAGKVIKAKRHVQVINQDQVLKVDKFHFPKNSKTWFNNVNRKEYTIVNLSDLNVFEDVKQ